MAQTHYQHQPSTTDSGGFSYGSYQQQSPEINATNTTQQPQPIYAANNYLVNI